VGAEDLTGRLTLLFFSAFCSILCCRGDSHPAQHNDEGGGSPMLWGRDRFPLSVLLLSTYLLDCKREINKKTNKNKLNLINLLNDYLRLPTNWYWHVLACTHSLTLGDHSEDAISTSLRVRL
jgi:hypothetical protein